MSTFRTGSVLNQRKVCKEMQKRMTEYILSKKNVDKIKGLRDNTWNYDVKIKMYGSFLPTKEQINVLERLVLSSDICIHIKLRYHEKMGRKYYFARLHKGKCGPTTLIFGPNDVDEYFRLPPLEEVNPRGGFEYDAIRIPFYYLN